MASDRDSGPPQAPRRAPVHELDTAHDGATTLARLILSPIGIKRPIEVTQLHQQCTLIQPHESYLLLFGDVNIRSGQQPSPAAPPLGRQSLLPGTHVVPLSHTERCQDPRFHASQSTHDYADLFRVCEEFFGAARNHWRSHAVFKTPWLGDLRVNIQNDHARPRHTKSDRCSKQSRS